jgi:hypothetical protein
MITASPLTWPEGWKRTPSYHQRNGRFLKSGKLLTVTEGVSRILEQLARMGIDRQDVIVSTNVRLRLDGLPRSNEPEPADRGASVYWKEHNKPMRCMACDQYNLVADNLAAIAATLDAMRAIERHGGSQILERAFTGFAALPEKASQPWREVLGIPAEIRELSYIEQRFKELALIHHPDHGGDSEKFRQLVAARDAARLEMSA